MLKIGFCALFVRHLQFFYASLLLKTTSAIHSAERLSASLMIWEYKSLVVLAFECPSLPEMLMLSMPLKYKILAIVCLKAWGLICGSPLRFEKSLHHFVMLSGRIG